MQQHLVFEDTVFCQDHILPRVCQFATLHRLKIQLFSHTGKKVEVVINGKAKTIEANGNVISRLLALSSKLNRKIDMQAALKFPLSAVPLSLAHPDGSRRTTDKSVY